MFSQPPRMREVLVQLVVPLSLATVLGCAGACGERIQIIPATHQVYNASRTYQLRVGFTNRPDDSPQYTVAPGKGTDIKFAGARYGIMSANGSPNAIWDLNWATDYFYIFFESPSPTLQDHYRILRASGASFQKATIFVAHCDPLIAKEIDAYVVKSGTAITPGKPSIASVPFDNTSIHRVNATEVDPGSYDIILTPSGSTTQLSKITVSVSKREDYIVAPYEQAGVSKTPLFIRRGARLDFGAFN